MIPAPSALLEVDKIVPPDDPKCLLALRRGRLLRMLAEYRQKKPIMSEKAILQQCKFMIEDIDDQMENMTFVDPFEPLGADALRSLSASVDLYAGGVDSYSSIR
ncbi:hypothetical protein KJ359_002623 [Pestalotiopsis sp. 9143b]|nr:hypothetical protein KJ359_002623 [Pestalotiopsis sp. 9143b]